MKCTFFGHRNAPETCKSILKKQIIYTIENYDVDTFYVGNNGNFDTYSSDILKEISSLYPKIKFYIVLAYLPTKKPDFDNTAYEFAIYPEGLEKVPLKFAIDKRNHWMLKNSDIVITYVSSITGGAYKFKTFAEKKNKKVINITDYI